MHSSIRVPEPVSWQPLYSEPADQGDPYLLAVPDSVPAAYRYYLYVTRDEPVAATDDAPSPRTFPVYASDDLVTWHALGPSLMGDETPRAYWAPCVCYVPSLERPYVMLYSRSVGVGEEAHIGHVIRRADSFRPEGPFIDSGDVLTPDTDFAIDPDVYRAADGSLRLAWATDFVADTPLGTGIVEAPVSEYLTHVLAPPTVLARPSEEWHGYDAARRMPWKQIPGIDWHTDTVAWNTVEAPVGGLVNPQGRRVYLYSGGCFFGFYAIGALIEEAGELRDVSDDPNFVARPMPERGIYAPGHCSLIRDGDEVIGLMLHARFGTPEAPRQMCVAPLRWRADGLPEAEVPPAGSP